MTKKKEKVQQPQQPIYPANLNEIRANMAKLQQDLANIPTSPEAFGFQMPNYQQQPMYPQPQRAQQYPIYQDVMPPRAPTIPIVQPAEDTKDESNPNAEVLPKRRAAIELMRQAKITKYVAVIGVAAPWAVVLGAVFDSKVGGIFAACASALSIYFLYNSQKIINTYAQKYSINAKTLQ